MRFSFSILWECIMAKGKFRSAECPAGLGPLALMGVRGGLWQLVDRAGLCQAIEEIAWLTANPWSG